ncbi:D-tyrosyl-tRNA(Tyr) deacylase [Patescibacteria group bacterium]|nr:D-tyrosyl-tRNA(Tyr) deacylase [Patescibacteria group bacterium]
MRALLQRTSEAKVVVDGKTVGQIGPGLVVFLGITHEDGEKDIDALVNKIVNLRVFPSDKGYFDKSLLEEKKDVLIVSQFTLYGSCNKGRRPDFMAAAKPEVAEPLYDKFVNKMKETGINVATGEFQAMMDVHLVNNGPVTFMLET